MKRLPQGQLPPPGWEFVPGLAGWVREVVQAVAAPADGKDGLSAYELAVQQGFEGGIDEWLLSLKGEQGDRGADGRDGLDGRDGPAGRDGEPGRGPTPDEVRAAVEKWLTLNAAKLKGKDGRPGKDGADGKPGQSAYELAVKLGFKGDERAWVNSFYHMGGSSHPIGGGLSRADVAQMIAAASTGQQVFQTDTPPAIAYPAINFKTSGTAGLYLMQVNA